MKKHFEMTTAPILLHPNREHRAKWVRITQFWLVKRNSAAIHAPVLAICAFPHHLGRRLPDDAAGRAKAKLWDAWDEERVGAEIKAFETGIPSARIVRLPHEPRYLSIERGGRTARDECFYRNVAAVRFA